MFHLRRDAIQPQAQSHRSELDQGLGTYKVSRRPLPRGPGDAAQPARPQPAKPAGPQPVTKDLRRELFVRRRPGLSESYFSGEQPHEVFRRELDELESGLHLPNGMSSSLHREGSTGAFALVFPSPELAHQFFAAKVQTMKSDPDKYCGISVEWRRARYHLNHGPVPSQILRGPANMPNGNRQGRGKRRRRRRLKARKAKQQAIAPTSAPSLVTAPPSAPSPVAGRRKVFVRIASGLSREFMTAAAPHLEFAKLLSARRLPLGLPPVWTVSSTWVLVLLV
jgi:hypothetical protein